MREMLDEDEVRKLLQKACEQAGSQRAWAMQHNLTSPYVSDVIAGARSIGPAICAALGVEKVVQYRLLRRQKAAAA
jgi:hypothetical protein